MIKRIPQISYIIPARNEEKYLADCIASIRSQNIGVAYEIIVVDNMSSDKTAEIATSTGARVVQEQTVGLAHVRMCGIREAKGEILVFVDADTRLPSGWTVSVLKDFSVDSKRVAVSCGFSFYDAKLFQNIAVFFLMEAVPLLNVVLKLFNKPNVIYGSAFAVKKDALLRAGGVNMEFPFYAEDIALSHKITTQGKVFYDSSLKVQTSARRYHRLGMLKTYYYYSYTSLLLELGFYERAKKLSQTKLE